MDRGATFQLTGSPWAREALGLDPARAAELGHRALSLRVKVGIVGKSETGPWVVRVRRGERDLRFAGHELLDVVAFGLDRWVAGADATGIRWAAGPDRLAHGHRKGSARALCGASPISPQFQHPERSRCQACWEALDGIRVAA